jgi:hypothetical protein
MSTNRLTRGPKQLFGATAVLAALVVPPALATSSAGAAPLATATVQIDGTSLSTTSLDIHNPDGTTTETVPTTSVQTLTLQEGTYSFDAGASAFACNPSLTTAGTWSIPSSCGAAWSGNGTTTLVLRGLPLTLDAAALSTGIEPLMYGLPAIPAGGSATFTLMPEGSEMVVGSGEDTSCGPGLAPDGAATVNG